MYLAEANKDKLPNDRRKWTISKLMKTGAHLFTKWATYMKCPESTALHFHSLFLVHYSEICVPNCYFLYCAPWDGENSNDYKVSPRNNSYKLSTHISKGSIIASHWLKTKQQLELKYITESCPVLSSDLYLIFPRQGHLYILKFLIFCSSSDKSYARSVSQSGRQPRNVDMFFNFSSLQVTK